MDRYDIFEPAGTESRGSTAVAGDLLAGALAILVMVCVLAGVYWVSTGISPWPVFMLAELPGAGFGFVILALSSPRRR
jgi:hypothetical protein